MISRPSHRTLHPSSTSYNSFSNLVKCSTTNYIFLFIIFISFSIDNRVASEYTYQNYYLPQPKLTSVYSPRVPPFRTYHADSRVVLGEDSVFVERGKFTPWSAPSECSRKCGGGVAVQTRACLNETACLGPTTKYFSCNLQPCQPGSEDFREQQCKMFNKTPLKDGNHTYQAYWISRDNIDDRYNPCSLYCRPIDKLFIVKLSEKVVDGTKCYNDEDYVGTNLDICVDGKCMPVGCDGRLGSNKTEDKCRVCGGDNQDCNTVRDTHRQELSTGYNDILMIPRNATNIRITELNPTRNFFAVRNENQEFFLNGNWTVDISLKKFTAGGTRFVYERRPEESPVGPVAESLYALGPLKEPIYVMVVRQDPSPGFQFEYSVHKDVPIPVLNAPDDLYQYTVGDFGPCSKTCGGGTKTRIVRCVQLRFGLYVPMEKCAREVYPNITTSCNHIPCPPAYHVGKWSKCHCSGYRHRNVFCEKILEHGERRVLDEKECEGLERPPSLKVCPKEGCIESLLNNTHTDYENNWTVGEWSKCDSNCGPGKRNRTVTCLDDYAKKLNDTMCEGAKPPTEEECDDVPCEFADWVTTEWSNCSLNCASKIATRKVLCAGKDGKVYSDSQCDPARRPADTMNCPKHVCEGVWFTSEWSSCSTSCGIGVQTRSVICGKYHADNDTRGLTDIQLNATNCPQPQPKDSQQCVGKDKECGKLELAGPWTECVCNKRTRNRVCIGKSQDLCTQSLLLEEECKSPSRDITDVDSLPLNATESCCESDKGCCPNGLTAFEGDVFLCPRETVLTINAASPIKCSESTFGCCPDTEDIALGPFKFGCKRKCSATRHGCCEDGITAAENKEKSTCPPLCVSSKFGCCPDKKTAANEDKSSCPPECASSEFGCCSDNKTAANKDKSNCPTDKKEPEEVPEVEGSGEVDLNVTVTSNPDEIVTVTTPVA